MVSVHGESMTFSLAALIYITTKSENSLLSVCKCVSLSQLSIICAVKTLPIYLQLSKSLFPFAVKTVDLWAEETAQCLRELMALAEDQGLVPSAHMGSDVLS